MRSRLLYGAAFFIASYCLSCKCSTKTIDCPGYQGTKLKNWFDYSDNQLLSFKTSSGEQKTFNLRNTLTTEPYRLQVATTVVLFHVAQSKDLNQLKKMFSTGQNFRSTFMNTKT